MDNKIISFKYKKADGSVSSRLVYLIHEDRRSYVGFDFSKLTSQEQNVVKKVFDSKPITLPPTTHIPLDYVKLGINKAIFQKAYRTFLKERILR